METLKNINNEGSFDIPRDELELVGLMAHLLANDLIITYLSSELITSSEMADVLEVSRSRAKQIIDEQGLQPTIQKVYDGRVKLRLFRLSEVNLIRETRTGYDDRSDST